MADTAALRQRRRRAHQRGDHRLCVGCDETVARVLAEPVDPVGTGSVADAVATFLAQRSYPEGDCRGVMAAMATRLAVEVDRSPGPGLARELAGVINHLGDSPEAEPDGLDEIRTRFHARRLAQLIGDLDPGTGGARRTHKG
jgi:hypothetical protein